MHLTIKAYNKNVFLIFLKKIKDSKLFNEIENINNIYIEKQFLNNELEINFYKNLTIYFKGYINDEVLKFIDILLDKKMYVGFDEVGVGEGVGPIVVASLKFKNLDSKKQILLSNIKDSKKMSFNDINNAYKIIKKHSNAHVKILYPLNFNQIYKKINNVKKINALLQNELILKWNENDFKIIDEFVNEKKFLEYIYGEKSNLVNVSFVQKAEEKYLEVACAAIVAKYIYNEWLINYCLENKINLEINNKVQAQKLYLNWRDGKIKIPDENSLIKKW